MGAASLGPARPAPDREAVRILRELRRDFVKYARSYLKIRPKDAGLCPLVLNHAQLTFHAAIEEQKRRTGMVRAITIKGRQQGISTYVQGRFYHAVTGRFGARAFILTHVSDATKNIFEMTKRYHDHMPAALRPETRTDSASELDFVRLDSGYRVSTAGSRDSARSSTIQLLHGSEVAYWINGPKQLSGALQAVPLMPGTEIILESTANGVGGVFHEKWVAAESGDDPTYLPVFICWTTQPEYSVDVPGLVMTPEERELVRDFGLTPGQIGFRRFKVAELNSADLFRQEYPLTPEEAFLFSGRRAFDADLLRKARREVCAPVRRYEILPNGTMIQRDDGRLMVWGEPESGARYYIGADVAEGLAVERSGADDPEHGGHDWSSADVIDHRGVQVAHWHGAIAPDEFGRLLKALSVRYRNALLGIERNNHGLTTCIAARDAGCRNLYSETYEDRTGSGKVTHKIGWGTDAKTKPLMIDELMSALRSDSILVLCKSTASEMSTYIVNDRGGFEAQAGCHDDRVMSLAIANMMRMKGR